MGVGVSGQCCRCRRQWAWADADADQAGTLVCEPCRRSQPIAQPQGEEMVPFHIDLTGLIRPLMLWIVCYTIYKIVEVVYAG